MKLSLITFAVAFASTVQADPIHVAVQSNQVNEVRALLKASPRLASARDGSGATPLHYAIDNREIVELLLEGSTELNAVNKTGETALHLALVHGQTNTAALLISRGATVDIFSAAALGETRLVTSMIQSNGSLVKTSGPFGATPLHWAAGRGNSAIVKLLLARNADAKARDASGRIALHWAALYGRADTAATLLNAHPSLLDLPDPNNDTALQFAASFGAMSVVDLLLSCGARVNIRESSGSTALHHAARSGYVPIAEMLLTKGAAINDKNLLGNTPLHNAVLNERKEMALFLLSRKADPSLKNKEGQTPLDLASGELGAAMVAQLGPEHDLLSFYWALQHGATNTVTTILQRKLSMLRYQDNRLPPPLHVAARNGHCVVAEMLLAKGADVNGRNTTGQTPLHLAAAGGYKPLVELLLTRGASINARDTKGTTPLGAAVKAKQIEIIKLLRQKGARD